jgi:hypothetical protein
MSQRALVSLLLFLAVLAAYLSNGRTVGAGDTLPAAYLPWSLIERGSFALDGFPALFDERARSIFPLLDGLPYYVQYGNGHYLSAYSPGPAVLALPAYVLPVLWGAPPSPEWAGRLEKLSAATITAASVLVLFWALRLLTSEGWALAIALVYALGTSSLSVSAQALWQHGPSQLFLSLCLYCLARGQADHRYLAYAGFPMGAAVVMRSTDLLLVLPAAAWVVYAHRRRALSMALWALGPLAALAAYHVVYFGVRPGQDGHSAAPWWALFAQIPLSEGLPGVLVSPSRGLFVYSPVLLFSVAGMIAVWRGGPGPWRALSLGPVLVTLLIGKWLTWWGGHSWGPRLLADIDPVLCLFLYPVTPLMDRHRLARVVFVALALWSVAAHAMGAFLYDRRWDGLVTDESYARLWPFAESPLAFYGREALSRLSRPGGWWPRAPLSDAGLAAAIEAGRAPVEVMSGERFVTPVSATNTGSAAWRAAAPGDRGAVRLGWRWYRGEREVAAGREPLLADVSPGRSVRLAARIVSPVPPGDYTLVLDLISEGVAWFGDHGRAAAIRLPVRVLPLDVGRMLSAPVSPGGPAPAVALTTDRPSYRAGERLELAVALRYPHRPRAFDAYLILEPPDGPALFFDGHAMPRAPRGGWPAWVRGLPLPAQVSGRFALPLAAFPAGAYRWHLVLTEPGALRPLARAAAGFRIEP